ncbi:SUMF1/EgtB/PvdO family nonheme iron enzyme [candidate division WOR-3 bacterium]|nr:SUMF1/EgtB/PvdO family nonheme iron enzyme [candidate division WOR-3 bacterium]
MQNNCPNCFFPISKDDKVCPNCGLKLPQNTPPPPKDLPPPPPPIKAKKEFSDVKSHNIPSPPKDPPHVKKEAPYPYDYEETELRSKLKPTLIFIFMFFAVLTVAAIFFSNKYFKKPPQTPLIEDKPRIVPEGYSFIPEGISRIGSTRPIFDDEKPTFRVKIDSFFMKTTPVTNRDFAVFVQETGYTTDAERDTTLGFYTDTTGYQHDGGTWRNPQGPDGPSALDSIPDHPVTQVTWFDAARYCNWLSTREGLEVQYDTLTWQCLYTNGYRLPTEFEFEYASQGGSVVSYPWGDGSPGIEKVEAKANHAGYSTVGEYIQDMEGGDFKAVFSHMAKDGYMRTSPVTAFSSNNFGLYDMAGNVWQWCSNYYSDYPPVGSNYNPRGSESGEFRSMRGGSFGHDFRYLRCSARGKNIPMMAIELIGFRTMRSF